MPAGHCASPREVDGALLHLESRALRSYVRSVTRFTDPKGFSDKPLAPTTPRWTRRYLGVGVVAVVALALGWSAWHYTHRVPSAESESVPVPGAR